MKRRFGFSPFFSASISGIVLLSSGVATADDFCSKPYEAVCEGPDAQARAQRRADTAAIGDALVTRIAKSLTLPESKGGCGVVIDKAKWAGVEATQKEMVLDTLYDNPQWMLCYGRKLETELWTKLTAKFGIHRADMSTFYTHLQKELAGSLNRFTDVDPTLRAQMASSIESVELTTSENFSKQNAHFHNAGYFFDQCGSDMLDVNAFAWPAVEQIIEKKDDDGAPLVVRLKETGLRPIILCPGVLLEMLSVPATAPNPMVPLFQIMSHETGHFVHAIRKRDYIDFDFTDTWPVKQAPGTPGPAPTKSVVTHYYYVGPDDKPIVPSVWARNYVPAYKEYISCLETDYKDSFGMGPESTDHLAEIIDALGHTPDAVENHLPEASADLWGAMGMAAQFKSYPNAETIRQGFEQAMYHYCPSVNPVDTTSQAWVNSVISGGTGDDPNAGKAPEDVDLGGHPSRRYRIEMAAKQPVLRALLGCSPVAADEKPYCDLLGEDRNP